MPQIHANPSENFTRIVIVGAGAAGINTAQVLARALTPADNTEVIMLEKNSCYVIGAPRAYVNAKYTDKMFIPYDNAIPVSSANLSNEVTYHTITSDDNEDEDSEKLHFDYLILAMGSTYSVPIKPASRDYARSIMEGFAAKIKSKYPTKTVTIIEAVPVQDSMQDSTCIIS
ncbi:Pyridine nucleotide-disulfide oxidoreductase [Phytophthora palmivora]|uniref:Pyridine nucleotide-disulfide oxidoreductase n=1 Tax=Phytophthora palmivora TaxID=4796 RepID=A0A2P4YC65_9STRA|nr:Pyridine nucleotide-disulfide oxidoreductase [Phytophthora palmivora]